MLGGMLGRGSTDWKTYSKVYEPTSSTTVPLRKTYSIDYNPYLERVCKIVRQGNMGNCVLVNKKQRGL